MQKIYRQILFKILSCMLVMALLVPTAIRSSHIFMNHHHEICKGEPQTHLHKADLECDFCKFKLSTPFTIPTIEYEFISTEVNHQEYAKTYSFLSEYQQLHFSLRGPPHIDFI